MTNEVLEHWLSTLPAKADQYSIVFIQLGLAASDVLEAVLHSPGVHLNVKDFLASEETAPGATLFLHGLEVLAADRGERLGSLRERVMRLANEGRPVVMLSASPKTAFPDTIGSDVISDAKQVFAPAPSILDPSAFAASNPSVEYFAACVRELGDRTLVALADALWELQLAPAEALLALSKPNLESLRGAGLVLAKGALMSWQTGSHFKQFRLAVALVSSESVTPRASVPDTFAELWTLERMLRNMIRRALVARMGDSWRENCLSDGLKDEVIERARRDSQPGAERTRDLRDPLEWLTTTELLDLREHRSLGSLGMESYLWGKLRVEIVPIRNKVAHMRVVSEDDARRASMWRKVVAKHAD